MKLFQYLNDIHSLLHLEYSNAAAHEVIKSIVIHHSGPKNAVAKSVLDCMVRNK
jgi:hypothetical protein